MSDRPTRERTWPTYFAFDVQDYEQGTKIFDAVDHGCYMLLLLAQFASRELRAIPDSPRDLKLICKGRKPSKRVLGKFDSVEVDGVFMLRNARMAKEADIALKSWTAAKDRRDKWKDEKRRQRQDKSRSPGDVPPDTQPDGTPDNASREQEREQEQERDSPSLRSGESRASSQAGAGNGSEPANSAPEGCLAHDPSRPWEQALALRCVELALKIVDADGREHVTEEDRRTALEAATVTSEGRVARQVRGLPREWVEVSIAQADAFEAENFA